MGTFPAGNQGRYPAGYSFICFEGDDPVAGPTTFSLGSNDVVIIKDTSGAIVATSPQRARWGAYGVTYARVSTDNENFVYTTTPTPGAENKIDPLIRINEVSNGATEDICNGRQWLEVNVLQGRGDRNAGPLDFTDVVLTNDQAGGSGNHVSFTFPAVEYREGYSVLCMMGEDPATSPQFLITQGDTVSMLDPFGHTFSAIVYSHLEGMSAGTSYSYNDKTGSFEDTTTPTPGEDNVFTKYADTPNESNADDDDKERKKKGCSKDSDCKSNEECSDRDICVTKEKSSCVIDKKKVLAKPCSGCEDYEFEVFKNDAKCYDANDNKYSYGGFNDIKKFSKCAEACVKDGNQDYLYDLRGYEWDCEKNKCKCLYDKGILKRTGDYDFDGTDYKGNGYIKKSKKSSGWVCAIASKGNGVEISRGLRASGV